LSKYFELIFLQRHLVKIPCKLIIIWLNYEKKKKGAFLIKHHVLFWTQYAVTNVTNQNINQNKIYYLHLALKRLERQWTKREKGRTITHVISDLMELFSVKLFVDIVRPELLAYSLMQLLSKCLAQQCNHHKTHYSLVSLCLSVRQLLVSLVHRAVQTLSRQDAAITLSNADWYSKFFCKTYYMLCPIKNIPNIFDCNLKTNYQILITFRTNIPDTTCHQMTVHPMYASTLPTESRSNKIYVELNRKPEKTSPTLSIITWIKTGRYQ